MTFETLFAKMMMAVQIDRAGKKILDDEAIKWSEAAFQWCNDPEIEAERDGMLTSLRFTFNEEFGPHLPSGERIKDFKKYEEAVDDAAIEAGKNDSVTKGRNAANKRYNDWKRGKGGGPGVDSLAKFSVFLVFLVSRASESDFYVQAKTGEHWYSGFSMNAEALAKLCMESLGFAEDEIQEEILQDDDLLVFTVFAACLHASHPSFQVKRLYLEYLQRDRGFQAPRDLDALKDSYLKALAEQTREMNLRDVDVKLRKDVCDFYVVPRFTCNGQEKASPVSKEAADRLVIRSETGRGKSILLQALSLCAGHANESMEKGAYKAIGQSLGLEGEALLPVLIRAETVNQLIEEVRAEKGCKPSQIKITQDLLFEAAVRMVKGDDDFSVADLKEVLKSASQSGRPMFLFDAYDELAYNKRKSYRESVGKILDEFPQSKVVLTSRNIDFSNFEYDLFQSFELYWEIEPFNETDIRRLCRKWKFSSGASEAEINALVDSILGNDYMYRLATNPYMLSQIISIRDENRTAEAETVLPKIINKLIDKRWDIEKYELGIEKTKMLKLIHKVLATIAADMFVYGGQHEMSLDEFEAYITEATQSVFGEEFCDMFIDEFIADIKTKSGLLIATDRGYQFQNRVIEGYLAAEGLVEKMTKKIPNARTEEDLRAVQSFMADTFASVGRIDAFYSDVMLMMFSILPFVRGEVYSRGIYEYGFGTLCKDENFSANGHILKVFSGLLTNSFGRNGLTNNKNKKGNERRSQMAGMIGVFSRFFPEPFAEIAKAPWLDEEVEVFKLEENRD